MGVKYVKDFEFPAQAGFHSSNMPARAGMSAKGMPSRAKPNAPARGAARMESGPKMGKGQGYAEGGRVKIQGRNQAEIKAAMAKAAAQRKAFEEARRKETAERRAAAEQAKRVKAAEALGRKYALAQPKSMSKQAGPVMAPTSIVSGRSVSKDYDSSMAPTKIEIPIPAPKKSSYGKYGMQEYAKGGSVKKLARGGTPVPGSKASLGRMPGSKDYYQISNPLSRVGIGSRVVNIPKQTNEQRQRLEAVHKGSRTNAFTGAPNPDYDPAYDPAYEEQFGRIEEFRRDREPMKKASGGKVAKVMREYKAGKLHSGSKKGPMVKNPKQAMAIALSEARKSGEKVKKLARGGPTSREATGPTSGRATYIPNPFGKSIKVYTGPTGGSQPRVSTRNPRDIFGNINPNFNEAMREAEETRALEEMRMNREPVRKAYGGKVGKYAMGGAVDNYAGKTGPYRGSPKKAKMLGRQDRRAREAMERAEKHAPGRSIDMPDRKAHGGMMRRKVA
jgi:hypothetical protein